ncbi:MAG: esterase/lipase family protein, partial [bacterium]
SVGKALKLYFFKTVLRQDDVNELQVVTFNGAVKQSKSGVDQAAAKAKNVLLLIHDLIGGSKTMAEGIQSAGIENKFDLVLGYDYENLNTSLQTTAENLKDKLESAGFGDKDNKKLTILAHGMGGLVARWLIEQDGGNDFVDHLVMCGTPNEGTPFGNIDKARKLMGLVTTVAMSTFPALAGFGGAIIGILNRSKEFTPTLEEMNTGSDFMKSLKRSDDPGVAYTLLAGDINGFEETSDDLFKKLLDKASKSAVFDMIFSKNPHDMLATIDSIKGISTSRKPAPKAQTIACHHLNYFTSDAGLAALATMFDEQ